MPPVCRTSRQLDACDSTLSVGKPIVIILGVLFRQLIFRNVGGAFVLELKATSGTGAAFGRVAAVETNSALRRLIAEYSSFEVNRFYDLRDWSDLSLRVDPNSKLGRAIRLGRRYFTDEELIAALDGSSRDVTLTVIDSIPVFVNAAMMTDAMGTNEPVMDTLAGLAG